MKKILRSKYLKFRASIPETRTSGMPAPQEKFEKKEVAHAVKKEG